MRTKRFNKKGAILSSLILAVLVPVGIVILTKSEEKVALEEKAASGEKAAKQKLWIESTLEDKKIRKSIAEINKHILNTNVTGNGDIVKFFNDSGFKLIYGNFDSDEQMMSYRFERDGLRVELDINYQLDKWQELRYYPSEGKYESCKRDWHYYQLNNQVNEKGKQSGVNWIYTTTETGTCVKRLGALNLQDSSYVDSGHTENYGC